MGILLLPVIWQSLHGMLAEVPHGDLMVNGRVDLGLLGKGAVVPREDAETHPRNIRDLGLADQRPARPVKFDPNRRHGSFLFPAQLSVDSHF